MVTKPLKLERHYFYDEDTKTIFYSKPMKEMPYEPSLIHIGSSDNPRPIVAAAYFTQRADVTSGYKLQELWSTKE